MEKMDKLSAISYLTNNKPVCDNCLRGNLEEIRIAVGLYQSVKDIVAGNQDVFSQIELDAMVNNATSF